MISNDPWPEFSAPFVPIFPPIEECAGGRWRRCWSLKFVEPIDPSITARDLSGFFPKGTRVMLQIPHSDLRSHEVQLVIEGAEHPATQDSLRATSLLIHFIDEEIHPIAEIEGTEKSRWPFYHSIFRDYPKFDPNY